MSNFITALAPSIVKLKTRELYSEKKMQLVEFSAPSSQEPQEFQHVFSHASATVIIVITSKAPVVKLLQMDQNDTKTWQEALPANKAFSGFYIVLNKGFETESPAKPFAFISKLSLDFTLPKKDFQVLFCIQGWLINDSRNTINPKPMLTEFIRRISYTVQPLQKGFNRHIDKFNIPVVNHLESVIEKHLEGALPTIPSIANELNVSLSALKSKFETVHKKPIYEYYLDRKLERACELLRFYKVKEVSKRLGYSQAIKFILVFKKRYNMTPKKYIQLHNVCVPFSNNN